MACGCAKRRKWLQEHFRFPFKGEVKIWRLCFGFYIGPVPYGNDKIISVKISWQ